MPLQVVVAAIGSSRRGRRWLLLLAAVAAGVSGYGAYNVYHLPFLARRRRKLARLAGALVSVAEALSLVSADLNRFIRSDSGDVPASLQQVAKIARSEEFSGSISRASEAFTVGIVRGFSSAVASVGKAESWESEPRIRSSTFLDRFVDKLFSTTGSGFAAAAVGSFARNLVSAFYSTESRGRSDEGVRIWVRLLCDDKCRELVADCIQRCASTAVTAHLDRTMKKNAFDEVFSNLTNPKHEAKMKDILVAVCNGAVETLVKASHQVIMSNSTRQDESVQEDKMKSLEEKKLKDDGGGLVGGVPSTLAIPSNGRLLWDVTGRVTLETMRSFLDTLRWRLLDAARRGVSVIHEEVVERGFEVVSYVSAKSMVILTVCLALCVHLAVGGTKILNLDASRSKFQVLPHTHKSR